MHTPYLGRTKGYIVLGKGMRRSRKGKGHWLNKARMPHQHGEALQESQCRQAVGSGMPQVEKREPS